MTDTPLQSEVLAKLREEVRLERKKSYNYVVGLGLGGAGLAAALAGLPGTVSTVCWVLGAAFWVVLRRI